MTSSPDSRGVGDNRSPQGEQPELSKELKQQLDDWLRLLTVKLRSGFKEIKDILNEELYTAREGMIGSLNVKIDFLLRLFAKSCDMSREDFMAHLQTINRGHQEAIKALTEKMDAIDNRQLERGIKNDQKSVLVRQYAEVVNGIAEELESVIVSYYDNKLRKLSDELDVLQEVSASVQSAPPNESSSVIVGQIKSRLIQELSSLLDDGLGDDK